MWLEQRLSRHRKAGQGPQQQDTQALGRTSVCFFFSNYFGCVESSLLLCFIASLLSPVVASGGCSLVVAHGLLIAATSLVAENQL